MQPPLARATGRAFGRTSPTFIAPPDRVRPCGQVLTTGVGHVLRDVFRDAEA